MSIGREVRQRLWIGLRSGLGVADAAAVAGVSRSTGEKLMRDYGGVMEPVMRPVGRYLSVAEREEIAIWRAQGLGVREIGRRLGRCHTSIARELIRHRRGDGSYRAGWAQQRAEQRARRPKAGKLATHPRLLSYVHDKLCTQQWSPQQISHAVRVEFPEDESMRCSAETIYRSIYVQGRGELRRELARHLRIRRSGVRKPQHRPEQRKGRLVDPIGISQRPAEAADRAVAGHWEGDLIIGKAGRSQVGTLVERSTRFVMLVHLPTSRRAEDFAAALVPVLAALPEHLRRSLTWDQGKEMALHQHIALAADIKVFFCDPHSPWQRGSNENTNGLLRQYLPRTEDLSRYTPADLAEIATKLNTRPRQTLNWDTPGQRLQQLLCDHETDGGATTP